MTDAIKPVAWLLTDKNINQLQINSIQRLILRAKHAHYVNVYMRINGQDEHYEADWLKHLTANADAIASLLAENERLREELAAPGGKLQPQLQEAIQDCKKLDQLLQSVIAERNRALRLVGEHEAESRRLREELAAAQKDKRELLEQLRFIRTHLYAATVQRSPTDDQIIADHIEQAYRRANEVIKDAEKRDE